MFLRINNQVKFYMGVGEKMEKLQDADASIEFVGYISGDYESFCFDVNREDFIKITGEEPVECNQSLFNDGTYRIYPTTLFNKISSGNNKCRIKISVEEIIC